MVPRRFFFPPHYSFTRASSRRIASPRFFFSFRSIFHQESDRVRHLSRLLAPASDYDDPSTTTVSSFGFDLWITDNRIRRTCSSCPPLPSSPYPAPRWSIATSATLCTPPFNGSHPVFLSFFSFFTRMPRRSPNFLFFPFPFFILSSSLVRSFERFGVEFSRVTRIFIIRSIYPLLFARSSTLDPLSRRRNRSKPRIILPD